MHYECKMLSRFLSVCVYSDAASPEEEDKADGPEGIEEE